MPRGQPVSRIEFQGGGRGSLEQLMTVTYIPDLERHGCAKLAPSNLVTETSGSLELFRDSRAVYRAKLLELDRILRARCRHLLFLRGEVTHSWVHYLVGNMGMINIPDDKLSEGLF